MININIWIIQLNDLIWLLENRVLDMRGDFSRTLERSSGRRDTSVEFSWNANRNPLQKLVIRTLLEPSVMNPNDWNAMIQLNYPGTFLRCNLEALTQRNDPYLYQLLFIIDFVNNYY